MKRSTIGIGLPLITAICLSVCSIHAAGVITLSVNSDPANGPIVLTNSVLVDSNQTFEILSVNGGPILDIKKASEVYSFGTSSLLDPTDTPY